MAGYVDQGDYQGEQQYASMRNETMDLYVRPPHDLPKGVEWVDWARFEAGIFYYMIPTSHTRESAQKVALESFFRATKQGPIGTTCQHPKQDEHEAGDVTPLYWEVMVIPRKKSKLRHKLSLDTVWVELADAGVAGCIVQDFKDAAIVKQSTTTSKLSNNYKWDRNLKRPVAKTENMQTIKDSPTIPIRSSNLNTKKTIQ